VDLPLQFQTNYDPRMARAFAALQGVKSRVYNSVALTTMLGISEEELRAFEPPPLEPSFNLLGAAVLITLIPPTSPDQGEPRLIVLDGGENLMRCAQQGEDIYGFVLPAKLLQFCCKNTGAERHAMRRLVTAGVTVMAGDADAAPNPNSPLPAQ